MVTMKSNMSCLGAIALLAIAAAGLAVPARGQANCFPTCPEDDAKFLAIAGTNLETLSDPVQELTLAVPAGTTSFEIGIFDGDGAEVAIRDGVGGDDCQSRWDNGMPVEYRYTLLADPLGNGFGTVPVELQTGFPSVSSRWMPNNEWCCSDLNTADLTPDPAGACPANGVTPRTATGTPGNFTVMTSPAAQAPSGNFFYLLRIELLNPGPANQNNLNAFKVRASGQVSVERFAQPFSYVSNVVDNADALTVFPTFDPNNTTYDGNFSFFFDVPSAESVLTAYDGDFDHGSVEDVGGVLTPVAGEQDVDDLDSPSDPAPPTLDPSLCVPPNLDPPDIIDPVQGACVPSFATPDAIAEGVPVGSLGTTGNPPDNIAGPFPSDFFVRDPAIRYDLISPTGTFPNDNPSGNQEWESFTLAVDPTAPVDEPGVNIDLGLWEMRIEGVDIQNQNAVRLPFGALCLQADGTPCEPLEPFLITALGDRVWLDTDADGVQDDDETGIADVPVRIRDENGDPVIDIFSNVVPDAVTDANGFYFFQNLFDDRQYTVSIVTPPAGLAPTYDLDSGLIDPDQRTDVTVQQGEKKRLDLDFGYQPQDSSCVPITVRDEFNSVSFSNNDGPDDWSGPWIEDDPAPGGAGPAAGNVQVAYDQLYLEDYPNTGGQPSAAREVDLSGAQTAALSFRFKTGPGVDPSDEVQVEVSSDGGVSWTVLEVFNGIYGRVIDSRSYDITPYISDQTQVRFRVTQYYGGRWEYFKADNVEISATCPGPGGCQPAAVLDRFDHVSFSNNDGSTSWAGDWIEDDPAYGGAGPAAGNVQVAYNKLYMDDRPNTGGKPSAAREVDLTGATSATLSFDFKTGPKVDRNDKVQVQVSADGGNTWTTLESITGFRGQVIDSRIFDLTPHISSQTQVRFRIRNGYGGYWEYFKADNVEIISTCPEQ